MKAIVRKMTADKIAVVKRKFLNEIISANKISSMLLEIGKPYELKQFFNANKVF